MKSELLEGIEYLKPLLKKVTPIEKKYLVGLIELFANEKQYETSIFEAVSEVLKNIFVNYPERFLANQSAELQVYVDRKKALFSTWYEFFPRSSSVISGQHGFQIYPQVILKHIYPTQIVKMDFMLYQLLVLKRKKINMPYLERTLTIMLCPSLLIFLQAQ